MRRWRGQAAAATLLVCCAWMEGCHPARPASQEEDVKEALNQYYAAEPACLWSEPVRIDGAGGPLQSPTTKEARALDEAGLIDRGRHQNTLTSAGRAFWREDPKRPGEGNLCFGRWTVTRVESVTPLENDLFHNTYQARFEVTMRSPALWTRMPQMQTAFPLMGQKVTAPRPRSATLRKTGKGWEVAVIAEP